MSPTAPPKILGTSVLACNRPLSVDGTVVIQKALTGMMGVQIAVESETGVRQGC